MLKKHSKKPWLKKICVANEAFQKSASPTSAIVKIKIDTHVNMTLKAQVEFLPTWMCEGVALCCH
jgi:hypothetical protein